MDKTGITIALDKRKASHGEIKQTSKGHKANEWPKEKLYRLFVLC